MGHSNVWDIHFKFWMIEPDANTQTSENFSMWFFDMLIFRFRLKNEYNNNIIIKWKLAMIWWWQTNLTSITCSWIILILGGDWRLFWRWCLKFSFMPFTMADGRVLHIIFATIRISLNFFREIHCQMSFSVQVKIYSIFLLFFLQENKFHSAWPQLMTDRNQSRSQTSICWFQKFIQITLT